MVRREIDLRFTGNSGMQFLVLIQERPEYDFQVIDSLPDYKRPHRFSPFLPYLFHLLVNKLRLGR